MGGGNKSEYRSFLSASWRIPSRIILHLSVYLKDPKFCPSRIFFMSKTGKNKKIILIIGIGILVLGFLVLRKLPLPNLPLIKGEEQGGGQVTFRDDIPGKISVYDFMQKLQSEGKITFTEKNYIGMGEFINSINGIKNNGSQNWIYYVNGKEAQVGVSNYKIKSGDVISWKYEKGY